MTVESTYQQALPFANVVDSRAMPGQRPSGDGPGRQALGYGQWNRALVDVVFSTDYADRPVYLELDERALAILAEAHGVPADSALEATPSSECSPDCPVGFTRPT